MLIIIYLIYREDELTVFFFNKTNTNDCKNHQNWNFRFHIYFFEILKPDKISKSLEINNT